MNNPPAQPKVTRPRVRDLIHFIPLKSGDPIPAGLREALNVGAFVRDVREAIQRGEVKR